MYLFVIHYIFKTQCICLTMKLTLKLTMTYSKLSKKKYSTKLLFLLYVCSSHPNPTDTESTNLVEEFANRSWWNEQKPFSRQMCKQNERVKCRV